MGNETESLLAAPYRRVLGALRDGPKSSSEIGCSPAFLRGMEANGLIKIDPDRFPDRYVPGNPLVARLPDDERPWPGWRRWNI